MNNIFKDLFDRLFEDNPLLTTESNETKGEVKKDRKPGAIIKSFMYQKEDKPQKSYNSDDLRKIDKQLSKTDEIEVNPISKRFTDNKKEKDENNLSLDEYDGKYTVEINSTAIGFPIRYNKKTGEVWLRFKDKDGKPTGKWYHYVDMDEDQFKSFMKAASKGRYVTKIMKYKNHDPAYGPTPRKRK